MATTSIRLQSSDGFPGGPVSACVELPPGGGLTLVDESSGSRKAAQADGPGRITWIEDALAVGESRSYTVESGVADGVGVEMADSGGSLDVTVGGEPFTSYHYGPEWFRPYFHPVLGPHGLSVTRGFPMVADVPGETSDHPHHKGIWSAYGEAAHVDNWAEAEASGRTLHRGFESVESGPVFGRFVALGDWVGPDGGDPVLTERRTVTIYATAPHRLVDYELALTATGSDALFGDTKEGGFISLRVATSMDVSADGRLENSRGGVGEGEVWGKRAEWCDYSGPVEGKTAGVAFLENPASFGHPTYWHARDYGLMSANPFGLSEFLGEGHNGDYTLHAGETMVFSYRVYIHDGDAATGQVGAMYRAYTAPPCVEDASMALLDGIDLEVLFSHRPLRHHGFLDWAVSYITDNPGVFALEVADAYIEKGLYQGYAKSPRTSLASSIHGGYLSRGLVRVESNERPGRYKYYRKMRAG